MIRYYYEQDGDAPKNSSANSHYVVDCYADPTGDTPIPVPFDFSGATMARKGRLLASMLNEHPHEEPWDTRAAQKDRYKCPPCRPLAETLAILNTLR